MVDSDRPALRKGWLSTRLAPRQVIDAERSEQDSPGLRARIQRGEQPPRGPAAKDAPQTEQPASREATRQAKPAPRDRVADAEADGHRDVFGPPADEFDEIDAPAPEEPAPEDAARGVDSADDTGTDQPWPDDATEPDADTRPERDFDDRDGAVEDADVEAFSNPEPAPESEQKRAAPRPEDAEPDAVRAAPSAAQRRRQAAERAARQIGQTRPAQAEAGSAPAVFGEAMSVIQAEFRPARDLVVVHQPESVRARAYRRLHAQLMARLQDQPETPAVAAVSPNPGEGRSSLAANLAVLFARAGVRVLLIDADLRTGGQERLFGCQAETGLSDWLRGEHALTGLWFEDLPGLVLVPAGRYDTGAAERLTHPGFRQWIARQGKADQVVIIDTAAGSQAEETQAVCSAAGGALLVCRRHRTPLSELRTFIDALEAQRVQFYGAALLD